MEEAIKETERFSEWMKTKVQSVHYANNSKMTEAYDRVLQDSLRLQVYISKHKTK
jgi:hypothetical protein